MKVALINDTHFGARNDSQAFMNYFRKFYEEILFPTLEERGIRILSIWVMSLTGENLSTGRLYTK